MTETQDQLDVLPRIASDASETRIGNDATESQQRARRRSGSLTTMLLPELQALAGSMGISSAKVRKSDLVTAIQNAQQTVSAPKVAPEAKAGTRTRRSATRSAGSADPETATSGDTAAPASGAAANSGAANTAAPASGTAANSGAANGGAANGTALANGTPAHDTAPAHGSAAADSTATGDDTAPANGARNRTRANRGTANGAVANNPDSSNSSDSPVDNNSSGGRTEAGVSQPERANSERASSERASSDRTNSDRTNPDRGDRPERNRSGQRDRGDSQRGGSSRNGNNQANDRNGGNQSNGSNQANDRNGSSQSNDRNNQANDRNGNNQANDRNGNSQSNDRNGSSQSNDRNNQAVDSDEDEFGRRPRRYRDRRGRLRERFDGASGGARNDVEPPVSDDDVLIPVAGILDNVDDKNNWFIRVSGYFASPEDVFVATTIIRRYGLRRGDAVTGVIKQPRDGERKEKFSPLVRMDTVNGLDPELAKNRVEFTKLTPLYPQDRLRLETESNILTTRIIDLVMPIGKGQRALVVSPPKAGKTSVLQAIANAIAVNNPECHLMVVLVDERPEEVTDMQRSVKGEVIASTFDRKPIDHTMIAELSIERAKRLVEMGHDVVVLLDSITRLGRAYNLAAPASGRILSGGVDSTALYPPKRFLGAARNIEDGGSLTIIATALIETGSTMDTVIFEEFKGTGNAELVLDRKIADKRTFPAVDVDKSGTRKEEILMSPEELAVVLKLRRVLHALDPQQGIDLLLDRLKKSRTNIEFLMQIAKTSSGADDR